LSPEPFDLKQGLDAASDEEDIVDSEELEKVKQEVLMKVTGTNFHETPNFVLQNADAAFNPKSSPTNLPKKKIRV